MMMKNNDRPRIVSFHRIFTLETVKNQFGFSLVEIMVALLLGLFLISTVIQLFVNSKEAYRFQNALSRIQENGRLAMESMATDIRMAGYMPPEAILPAAAITGNGDNNHNNDVTVTWTDNGNQSRTYAIGSSTVSQDCVKARSSLRLNRNGGGLQELVEGVEAMRILYGSCSAVDTNSDGINDNMVVTSPFYQPATNISDWNSVCSVRVHLLMVSQADNVVKESQTIYFPADTNNIWIVNDHCLRQAFTFTVKLRNRVP